MNKLECQAKPLLAALEEAAEHGELLNLSRPDARTVALWAQKTAITHELTVEGPRVSDKSMGSRLRAGKAIRGTVVWAARNEDDLDAQIRHAYIEISDAPVVRPGDPYREVFMTALSWHYFTLLVYVGVPGRTGPSLPFDRWTPVCPCAESGIEYPPMHLISLSELNSRITDHRYWLPVIRNLGVYQL